MGYYWSTMEKYYCEYIKKYLKCQQHAHLFSQPSQALHPIQSLWPFSKWALDLIGQITPIASSGHKFIIIATEYFTKWVEAIPMTSTIGPQIVEFIENNIICRFSIPNQLIMDNGKNFKNKEIGRAHV